MNDGINVDWNWRYNGGCRILCDGWLWKVLVVIMRL